MALLQQGDYEKAVVQFSGAVRIDPANAEARQNLDLAQMRMKNQTVLKGRK
jgi:Flp pilus assembly protein TadD